MSILSFPAKCIGFYCPDLNLLEKRHFHFLQLCSKKKDLSTFFVASPPSPIKTRRACLLVCFSGLSPPLELSLIVLSVKQKTKQDFNSKEELFALQSAQSGEAAAKSAKEAAVPDDRDRVQVLRGGARARV